MFAKNERAKKVFDLLANGNDSRTFATDPTGERALATAELVRKNYRTLYLTRKVTRKQALAQIAEMKPRLRDGITKPDRLLEILSAEDEHPVLVRPARKQRGSILI